MTSAGARYDSHSEWYDQTFSAFDTQEERAFLRQYLGTGRGKVCLDVACGTGLYGQVIADARFLPVRDEAAPVAVGMLFHTDVEDFGAVAQEVARCLRPAGRFIYIGLHPCFIGPFVDRTNESRDLRLTFAS